MTAKSHPGDPASPRQMLLLADEYQRASEGLHELRRKRQPLSLAPFRLVAIHAIELYLSAMLQASGHERSHIRTLGHDLLKRAKLAQGLGLNLRWRTLEHLGALSANREYLVSRYGPELVGTASQPSRLLATLHEVAEKTAAIVAAVESKPRPARLCR